MKRLLFLLLVLVCSFSYGQTYQSMPQSGYGPVKRMLFDSVVTLPMGITTLRNISGGRDTAQIRYNKNDSSIYVYTGTQWVKSSGSSSIDSSILQTKFRSDTARTNTYNAIDLKLNISDTANKWLSSVSQPNDSSLTFTKDGTTSTYTIRAAVSGSSTRLVTSVYNNSGATILKGAVVYINGAHSSNLPTIALAKADNEITSAYTYGLVDGDISNNSAGVVIQIGTITGLNLPTSTYTDGQTLYLSPTVAGGYTLTKPTAPNHYVAIGTITRAHPTFGTIQIAIRNGFQLDEMSDVAIPLVPNDSTLLQFSRTDSLWHAVSPTNAIGGYGWRTSGNSDVNAGRFIGSTNNASLRFRTNNAETMLLDSVGRLQLKSIANNATLTNALQLANSDNTSFFKINTNSGITELSLKANNNNVLDSMVINDSGLIQPRTNASLWLKGRQGVGYNVVANRCASCGTGNIFSANMGTNAAVFNVTSTGATSIGAASAATSSLVDMSSTSLGLLIPRMTTTQRNAISSPASQLLIANSTKNTLDMYQDGNWASVAGDYTDDILLYRSLGSTLQAGPVTGIGSIQNTVTMFAGRSYWSAVYVKKTITITGAAWYQATVGSYTGNNYNGVALYTYSGGTLTLLDSSTRDNAMWQTAPSQTWGSKPFAGGIRTLAPGVYYLATFYNNSAAVTNPIIGAVYNGSVVVGYTAPLTTNSARLSGWETTLYGPPTTKTMSSFVGQGIYIGLCLY